MSDMSNWSQSDIRKMAGRESILDNTSAEEQLEFIRHQIKDPFDSGNSNYFRKLKNRAHDRSQLNYYCEIILSEISNEYPGLEFDYDDDKDLVDFTDSVYKFFIRNIRKLVFIFLREYLYNNKNRKGLIQEFQEIKISNYPKEVYGKKDFYILVIKMPAIVSEISKMDFRLDTFMQYIDRDDDAPMYIRLVQRYYDSGVIQDHGVYSDIMEHFRDSDTYDLMINKLIMKIKTAIIDPYLEESGMANVKPLMVEEPDDDDELEDADEDDASEDMDEGEAYDND